MQSSLANRAGSGPERIAVVVTHGVGEAEPGDCVRGLVATLRRRKGVHVAETTEVGWLDDEPAPVGGAAPAPAGAAAALVSDAAGDATPPRPCRKFPVSFHAVTINGRQHLTFADVYWADLTRVGTGRVSALLGLFRVIFEAHYVIDAMLDPKRGFAERSLRAILLWLSWLMRGPIAGLTVCTAAMMWTAVYRRPEKFPFYDVGDATAFATVLFVVFVAAAASRIWSDGRHDATWRTSLNWTAIAAAVLLSIVLAAGLAEGTRLAEGPGVIGLVFGSVPTARPEVFVRLAYSKLILLWDVFGVAWVVALVLVVVLRVMRFFDRRQRVRVAPPFAAIGILSLQLGLWTALVGSAVLPLLNRAQELIGLQYLHQSGPFEDAKAIKAKIDGRLAEAKLSEASSGTSNDTALRRDGAEEAYNLLDVATLHKADYEWIDRFIFAYGFNSLIVLGVMLIGVALLRARARLGHKGKKATKAGLMALARRMPHLVFNRWLLWFLVGTTLAQIVFHIFLSELTAEGRTAAFFFGRVLSSETIASWFASYKVLIMLLAWGVAVLLTIASGPNLANAVHIARDLIDHQYGPARGRVLKLRHEADLSEAERWPRRARIRHRLVAVLEALNRRQRFDRVVFLAHSQGTVVIYDFLKAGAGQDACGPDSGKPAMITFGSPLSHIYHRYFHEYRDLDRSLSALRACTSRWLNLYRIDDYIGQWVGTQEGGPIDNRVMGPGGHVNYWVEEEVAVALIEVLESVPQAGAADGADVDELALPVAS